MALGSYGIVTASLIFHFSFIFLFILLSRPLLLLLLPLPILLLLLVVLLACFLIPLPPLPSTKLATDKHVHAKRHDLHRGMRIYANICIYTLYRICMHVCVCVCVLLLFVTFQQLLSRATARGTRHQTGRQSKNGQQKTDNNFVLIAVNFMREWAQVEQGEWLCGCCSEMRLALRIRPTGRSINQSSTHTKK